jgi:hypothetical protein
VADVNDIIKKLIALSEPPASGETPESVRAAVKACELMRKHKVEFVVPRSPTAPPKVNTAKGSGFSYSDFFKQRGAEQYSYADFMRDFNSDFFNTYRNVRRENGPTHVYDSTIPKTDEEKRAEDRAAEEKWEAQQRNMKSQTEEKFRKTADSFQTAHEMFDTMFGVKDYFKKGRKK